MTIAEVPLCLGDAPDRGMTEPNSKPRNRPTTPRPVTASYLRNAALHYLSGRSANTTMLRQTLERRAKRRLGLRALTDETNQLIAAAVAECVALRLIDDGAFATGRAATLANKGLSKRRIAMGLRQKGLTTEQIAQAIAPDLDELAQARRFAERKRLGAWRSGGATPETRNKDLRALARAGFAYAIATKALAQTET
jgi:regulatory protein